MNVILGPLKLDIPSIFSPKYFGNIGVNIGIMEKEMETTRIEVIQGHIGDIFG